MKVERIGNRGYLFVFEFGEDTTNIYVINGYTHWFVVDTFLGPDSIVQIKAHLGAAFDDKPIIVVNTHSHFDHFWGNCAFPSTTTIVGHTLCKPGIDREYQVKFLAQNPQWRRGDVTLVAPNLTFEKRLVFEDDGVELFHSPGHTLDSISCIDREDQVLFVGDNIGLPIPSLYPGVRVEQSIETLEMYRTLDLPTLVTSHYNEVSKDLIDDHLVYLRKLADGDTAEYEKGETKMFNDWNKKMLARLEGR